jgi:hypothetical protein
MFGRISVAILVVTSVVVLGGSAQGVIPSGTISCSSHVANVAFTHPMSIAGVAGPFATNARGNFSDCVGVGNAGDPVAGGVYTWTLKSPNGPRDCPSAATTPTYVGGLASAHITWWTTDPVTGQRRTYTSTSNQLNFVTNDGQNPPTVTVQFLITGGAYVGSTITGTGTVTIPAVGAFDADCFTPGQSLRGESLTGGTVTVP